MMKYILVPIRFVALQWLKEQSKPRIAAINSFGYGGSNVHAIVREVESETQDTVKLETGEKRANYVLSLSARSMDALRDMADNHAKWLARLCEEGNTFAAADICYSLNERRTHHSHRLVTVFSSLSGASDSLQSFATSEVGWEKHAVYHQVTSGKSKRHTLIKPFAY